MRKPAHVTFTGLDSLTSISVLEELSQRYPIEWAILFSPRRQGRDRRYPPQATIDRVTESQFLNTAAHLCGAHSRNLMAGRALEWECDPGQFNRIQVNHIDPTPYRLREFGRLNRVGMIAQCRDDAVFPAAVEGMSWLFDASGGHGKAPSRWPMHPGDGMVGYAGGITPDNVLDVIERINAQSPYWIDMETGVRTDDWFDVSKCRRVCELIWPER